VPPAATDDAVHPQPGPLSRPRQLISRRAPNRERWESPLGETVVEWHHCGDAAAPCHPQADAA
jgi:hypothetical protein